MNIFNLPNGNNLDNYFRADFSMNYTFKFNGRIGLAILNLLNTNNKLNSYYIQDQNNNIQRIDANSLGLTPNLSFRMQF